MEWILALLATAATASYAVLLGRGIEQRRRWALEVARAIAMLHPSSADRYLFETLREEEDRIETLNPTQPKQRSDRLAA